jgi:hypothetical protein
MSSKQEIKSLFEAEIKNSADYATVIKIKQYIINEIITPNINQLVIYNFEIPQTEEQVNNIKLGMIVEFGFSGIISENYVIVDMEKFLM